MNSAETNNKKRLSLSFKLNFISVALMIAFAAGIVLISSTIQRNHIQSEYFDKAERAAFDGSENVSGEAAVSLVDMVESEDFRKIRAEGDEDKLREWLFSQNYPVNTDGEEYPLSFEIIYTAVHIPVLDILVSNDITEAYVAYEKDGEMRYLVSPNGSMLEMGTAIPDFSLKLEDDAVLADAALYRSGKGIVCRSGCYIYNMEHENTNILFCVDIRMSYILEGSRRFLSGILLFAGIIIAGCILLNMLFVRRFVTKPVKDLSEAPCRFGTEKDGEGYTKEDIIQVNIRSRDEISDLYQEIRTMQDRIVTYTNDLTSLTTEKARSATEMQLAADIQNSILQDSKTAFPDQTVFELAASMEPAKKVGGDFYEFFFTDENHLALIIADVSGKGIPAALFMMQSFLLLKSHALAGRTPAEILSAANEDICESNAAKMFVTVWLGILDIRTGKLVCANAGHEFPAVCGSDGKFKLFKDRHGLLVGCMEGVKYTDYELQLEKGGMLFVYTDGVPEADNTRGEFYGTDRMLKALTENASGGPDSILKAIRNDVAEFADGAEQFDDLTMLCIKYKGR